MQGSDNQILSQKYPQEAHVISWNRTFDATDPNLVPSYNCTSGGSVNHENSMSGKPIRRRSRASSKTPTTLLNANISNFRALVQHFTGCHGAPNSTCYKGPVTLNFERGSSCHSDDQHRSSRKEPSEQSLVSFGTNHINNINAFTAEYDPLFAPTAALTEYAPSEGDSLTTENFDMENFSLRDLRGPGDYTSTWETTSVRIDDSWSYSY